jgi:hypothetical protein
MERSTVYKGLHSTQILTVIFVVLKLCDIITWSWWWVLSPLWLPLTICLSIVLVVDICIVVVIVIAILNNLFD